MSNESLFYYALKRIAAYESTEWLRRNAERTYGLSYEEALEAAYENVRDEAKDALRGKRRPKQDSPGTHGPDESKTT